MIRAHNRSREVLAFIQSRIEVEGRPPTLEEIASACGFKSRSAAQRHVRLLEASGELHVTPRRARSARPKRAQEQAAAAAMFFEISPRDLDDLTDSDLRALVARLCMASLADAGLPPTSVIWGGDQRAPDGGIDVRLRTEKNAALPPPLDRGVVGIQVKATQMSPAEIRKEMCPGGVLRPSIVELGRANGAYLIVATDLVADEEYRRRLDTMKAAASVMDTEPPVLDYYDARRLADWTNHHPGAVAWVRARLGRPLQGWQPFSSWANQSERDAPFFDDKKLRITDPLDRENKLSLVDGLTQIRRTLRQAGHSVRLTGLSGVGKTRLAQALFEESAAPDALPDGLAIYTDTAQSPSPHPAAVLDELLAAHRRAILIVDNCGGQLHNQLSARCKNSNRVSLLTIEYDIREELANETNVFHLEAGSEELVENILAQKFPQLSQVNQRTIARFADGNSRVAIALAQTMERDDSLAGLNDTELFDRLFWLGKEINEELKIAAQACSLVYSFDVDDIDGELAQLAALVDLKPLALYRNIADLEARGLAQRRGKWRAILPHAVANRLAFQALKAIPIPAIEKRLMNGQKRLLKSFSRRLGYLHKSPEALAIAQRWLAPDGLLGDVSELESLHVQVFENIAPVDASATLGAIRRTLDGPNGEHLLTSSSFSRVRLVRIIRLIAWDADLFDRCMDLLIRFALAEPTDKCSDSTRNVIESLFQMYLSGTRASTEQRAAWVKTLLGSANELLQAIGVSALSSALKCNNLSSSYEFEFGARVRDFGAHPRGAEAHQWIDTFVGLAVEIGTGSGPTSEAARNALASQFRSLWTAGALEPLENAAAALLPHGWERGWLAIRQTLGFDGKRGLPPLSHTRLVQLEAIARPTTLVGQFKAVVLNNHFAGVDYADGEESPTRSYERAESRARELGELIAVDEAVFAQIAPLVVANVQGRQWSFGEGLASTSTSLKTTWAALVDAFEALTPEERNVQVFRGFLRATFERDGALFEQLLDESMARPSLAEWVPVLQLSVDLNDPGCDRLLASMNNPNVPAWVFRYLGMGRTTEHVPEERLSELLERLSIKPGGISVAIDILHMHIFGKPKVIGSRLTSCARELIANAPLTRNDHGLDYALGQLVGRFLMGTDAKRPAARILERISKAIGDYSVSRYDFTETCKALFAVQPALALDALVGDEDDEKVSNYVRRDALAGGRRSGALLSVPEGALLDWCRKGGPQRWIRVAPLLPAFEAGADDGELAWSARVKALLANAPDAAAVAETLIDVLIPHSWSGSRADVIRKRLPLLDQLSDILGSAHHEQVATWRRYVMSVIDREAQRELEEHRDRNERFE